MSVRQVIEKLRIQKTRLLLALDAMEGIEPETKHMCENCDYKLNDNGLMAFEMIGELEDSLKDAEKQSLVYIAGYVTRRDECNMEEDTFHYFNTYGKFQQEIDRGRLNKSNDRAAQWTLMCYSMFGVVREDAICRTSLAKIFYEISEIHSLGMTLKHCCILSNIFLKIHCKQVTPLSRKEANVKLMKFTEE